MLSHATGGGRQARTAVQKGLPVPRAVHALPASTRVGHLARSDRTIPNIQV